MDRKVASTENDVAPINLPRQRPSRIGSLLLVSLVATVYLFIKGSVTLRSNELVATSFPLQVNADDFDWDTIEPSSALKWVPCYERFECARLSVPLDYSEPDGEKAAIAMARLASKVPRDDARYRGPILFNPGGPGGSGVAFLKRMDDKLQKMLGDDFDLVGFDPRGVGATTPKISLFSTQSERAAWDLQEGSAINSTSDALSRMYARAQIWGKLAQDKASDTGQYVSTAVVARDMLSIVRANGREKLQYWGFSYGSILGATYAAMFPHNIERLVIDGVADSENYYATLWSNNLMDTERTLQSFYDSCSRAGPSLCAFHANTSSAVRARLENLIQSVKKHPVPVSNGTFFGIVDYTAVHGVVFKALYKPTALFKPLAEMLASLEAGNGEAVLRSSTAEKAQCGCRESPLPSLREATDAIRCSDGEIVDDSLEDFERQFESMSELSTFADLWSTVRVYCSHWRIRPKWRFAGPFVSNTSFPLLVVGNTADPVTPLWAARKMSKGFTGAVLLTQDSPGHCSLASTSFCTTKYIRSYFRDGTLPPPDTICQVDDDIFTGSLSASRSSLSKEDDELMDAAYGLSQRFDLRASGGGLMYF